MIVPCKSRTQVGGALKATSGAMTVPSRGAQGHLMDIDQGWFLTPQDPGFSGPKQAPMMDLPMHAGMMALQGDGCIVQYMSGPGKL